MLNTEKKRYVEFIYLSKLFVELQQYNMLFIELEQYKHAIYRIAFRAILTCYL